MGLSTNDPTSTRFSVTKKNVRFTGALLLATLALVVILAPVYWSHSKATTASFRIGYLPIIASMPLFVAEEQGYFRDEGIVVELTRFENSSHISTAFVSGRIKATASFAAASVMAIESRDPGKFLSYVVDAYTPEHPISGLVVLPSSGINSISELRGKRIGTFPGPNSKIVNDIIFRNHGIDPSKDVTLVELSPDLHIQALLSGQVDALRTTEPIPTQAVISHKAINIYPGIIEKEVLNPFPGGVSIISASFCRENPKLANSFVRAIYKAIDFLRTHPIEANQTLIKYTGIDEKVADALPTPSFTKASESNGESLKSFSKLSAKAGLIDKMIDLTPTFFKTNSPMPSSAKK